MNKKKKIVVFLCFLLLLFGSVGIAYRLQTVPYVDEFEKEKIKETTPIQEKIKLSDQLVEYFEFEGFSVIEASAIWEILKMDIELKTKEDLIIKANDIQTSVVFYFNYDHTWDSRGGKTFFITEDSMKFYLKVWD